MDYEQLLFNKWYHYGYLFITFPLLPPLLLLACIGVGTRNSKLETPIVMPFPLFYFMMAFIHRTKQQLPTHAPPPQISPSLIRTVNSCWSRSLMPIRAALGIFSCSAVRMPLANLDPDVSRSTRIPSSAFACCLVACCCSSLQYGKTTSTTDKES